MVNGNREGKAYYYLDPELHARLRMVAGRRRTTTRSYWVEALERRLAEEPEEHLTAPEAPVLAEIWDNPDDASYHQL